MAHPASHRRRSSSARTNVESSANVIEQSIARRVAALRREVGLTLKEFGDKTGLSDQIGWKNIHHSRAGIEVSPFRATPFTVNYHSWWLAEEKDAVYNIANTALGRIPAGAADRHVGQEIDVQVSRALTPQLQAAAGYAHIFPGRFLKEATPGASYSHPYVMLTYVFLAEK